jgi:hypothetical protein
VIRAALAALFGFALSVCASSPSDLERAAWKNDWNARLDVARSDFEHPCATRPFLDWADGFLAGCDPESAESPTSDCRARKAWVRERVEQCRQWTAWQLRNFGKHERVGGAPPSMHVE